MSYPSVHVKNFARIKEANVELAPLTLFVGDNNSGKSYLSSLIWGFYQRWELPQQNLPFLLFAESFGKNENDFQSDDAIRQWIEKGLREELCDNSMAVSEDTQCFLVSKINALLDRKKKRFVQVLFRRPIDIDHLSLHIPYEANLHFQMAVQQQPSLFPDDELAEKWLVRFSIGDFELRTSVRDIKNPKIVQKLFRTLLRTYFLANFRGTCSFFPASRTGFLLTYKSLINKALKRDFGPRLKSEKAAGHLLTIPQRTFLQSLVKSYDEIRGARSQKTQFLIDFIEKNLIGGTLSLNDLPVSDFLYRPDGLEDDLPMFLSSGVVTEIAPILAHLKYDYMNNRCVIEEPEMSLHPELQRKMAQVLIRLSKCLDSVLITTHSDLIVQHINNMIKLTCRADGKELANERGYTDDDIISAEQVRMYQFGTERGEYRTVVKKLEFDDNGFDIPTFGNAIRDLQNDVIAFYNDSE